MSWEEILHAIYQLGQSQGKYKRLYHEILNLEEEDPEVYEATKDMLVGEKFGSVVDMVMFLES